MAESNPIRQFLNLATSIYKKVLFALDQEERTPLHNETESLAENGPENSYVSQLVHDLHLFEADDPVDAAYRNAREYARDRDVILVDHVYTTYRRAIERAMAAKADAAANHEFMKSVAKLEQLAENPRSPVRVIGGGDRVGRAPSTQHPPRPRLRIANGPMPEVTLDNVSYPVSGDVANFFQLLVEADGIPVSMEAHGFRSRHIESLPELLRNLIARSRGKGAWIPREELWLS